MTPFRAATRGSVHRIAPLLGVILLTVLFVGSMHHHADGSHGACVVCTAVHAPAITAIPTSPVGAPTDYFQPVTPRLVSKPRPARLETAPSRAPPSA